MRIIEQATKYQVLGFEPIETDGKLGGVTMFIRPNNEDEIYYLDGEIVRYFPDKLSQIGLRLDMASVVKFAAQCLKQISTYAWEYNRKFNDGRRRATIESRLDENFFIEAELGEFFIAPKEKRGADFMRAKTKLILTIIDKNSRTGLISFKFTRQDLLRIVSCFKSVCDSYSKLRLCSGLSLISLENGTTTNSVIVRQDHTALIADKFIYPDEKINLFYVANRLINEFKIETHLFTLYHMNSGVKIAHYDDVTKSAPAEFEPLCVFAENNKLVITPLVLAAIYLYFNADTSVMLGEKYEAMLRAFVAGFVNEAKYMDGTDDEGIVGLVNFKESDLAIAKINKESDDKRAKDKNQKRIFLLMRRNNEFYEQDEKSNAAMLAAKLPALETVELDITYHIPAMIKALATAIDASRNAEHSEAQNENFAVRSFANEDGTYTNYYINIALENETQNKATAVLRVIKTQKDKLGKTQTLGAFRQPIFINACYRLLSLLLSCAHFAEISPSRYFQASKLQNFIFRNFLEGDYLTQKDDDMFEVGFNDEMGFDVLNWGGFKGRLTKHLHPMSESDIFMLNRSALNKLLNGRWLYFCGDSINISPDGYFSTCWTEFELAGEVLDKRGEPIKAAEFEWAVLFYMQTLKWLRRNNDDKR